MPTLIRVSFHFCTPFSANNIVDIYRSYKNGMLALVSSDYIFMPVPGIY
jgi:hypothetical protein